MVGPVVVVHGGAWAVPDSLEAASRAGGGARLGYTKPAPNQ